MTVGEIITNNELINRPRVWNFTVVSKHEEPRAHPQGRNWTEGWIITSKVNW